MEDQDYMELAPELVFKLDNICKGQLTNCKFC